METIYETTLEKVRQGATFKVSFKDRSLSVNGKKVDLQGMSLGINAPSDLDSWLDEVECLYDAYKYSRPTKASIDKSRKAYFKALSVDELIKECGHSALSNPKSRDEAQAELELFILLSLECGAFVPDELFAKDWFFQGSDKSLVICKNWF